MYDHLYLTAIQLDSTIGEKSANLEMLTQAMKNLPHGSDVVLLPELFSTGYIADPVLAQQLAEPIEGQTMAHVRKLAHTHSCAICGSFLAKENDMLYNRAFFMEPSGEVAFYDKRHLFNLSEEAKIVEKGDKLSPIIRFRGWNFAMAVCYDVRFPAWIRNLDLKYDVLLVPANWPERRSFAWTHLLQARAIENQAYVAGCNRGGSDQFGTYQDETYVYDYMGKPISTPQGCYITAVLNHSPMEKLRASFPVWRDADHYIM